MTDSFDASGFKDRLDLLRGHVNRLVEADLMRREVESLRAVVWYLATRNGGGLTIDRGEFIKIINNGTLDAWYQAEDDTFHIRARE